MKLMDGENGRLRKRAFEKEAKKARSKKDRSSAHTRHMTSEENMMALARADVEKLMAAVFEQGRPKFKKRKQDIIDYYKDLADQEKAEEKERLKAEKQREREAKQAEKEAEKERKRLERVAQAAEKERERQDGARTRATRGRGRGRGRGAVAGIRGWATGGQRENRGLRMRQLLEAEQDSESDAPRGQSQSDDDYGNPSASDSDHSEPEQSTPESPRPRIFIRLPARPRPRPVTTNSPRRTRTSVILRRNTRGSAITGGNDMEGTSNGAAENAAAGDPTIALELVSCRFSFKYHCTYSLKSKRLQTEQFLPDVGIHRERAENSVEST
jgi:hypothetical protein